MPWIESKSWGSLARPPLFALICIRRYSCVSLLAQLNHFLPRTLEPPYFSHTLWRTTPNRSRAPSHKIKTQHLTSHHGNRKQHTYNKPITISHWPLPLLPSLQESNKFIETVYFHSQILHRLPPITIHIPVP